MKTLIFILVLFFGFVQYKDSSNLLFSEDMTYEEDQRKMIQIDQTIKNLKLENAPSYKLIIVGTSPPKNKFNLSAHADLVGVSMFSFAYSNDMGSYYVNANIISMMDILGMHYESPTREEYLDVWKNKSSINDSAINFDTEVIDNFIIIRVL